MPTKVVDVGCHVVMEDLRFNLPVWDAARTEIRHNSSMSPGNCEMRDDLLGCFKWALSSDTAMDKIYGTL